MIEMKESVMPRPDDVPSRINHRDLIVDSLGAALKTLELNHQTQRGIVLTFQEAAYLYNLAEQAIGRGRKIHL